jgi:hypothetical protein
VLSEKSHLRPFDPFSHRATALYVDVFRLGTERVPLVPKMVVVFGGPHVFPAMVYVQTNRITTVQGCARQLFPHAKPF